MTWRNLLCVPCFVDCDDADDEHHIFFVDLSKLSSGDCESVQLRVSRKFKLTCFWVKKSTLYLFSSTKEVWTLELTEELLRPGCSLVLEESMLKYKASMLYSKSFPTAVQLLDERLLLFSSFIQSHLLGDFEIYDTVKNEWKALPPIQPFRDSFHENCTVDWAVFKDQQTLLVNLLNENGNCLQFELDITEQIWTPSERPFGIERINIAAVMKDEIVITPYQVFDMKQGRESDWIPSSFEDYIYEKEMRSCLVCESGGGECCFYIVQGTTLKYESTSKMSILTYSLDIERHNMRNRELQRREHKLPDKIKGLVATKMSLEKIKLAISLLGQELPPIDVKLINSSEFVVNSCELLMPLPTLSLCRVPASPKRKQVSWVRAHDRAVKARKQVLRARMVKARKQVLRARMAKGRQEV